MGKTYIDNRGYRRFTDSHKLVHRYVAEKQLGRKLGAQEVVHHKDRDKLNNDQKNLQVFRNQREHDTLHKIDAILYGKKASYSGYGHKNPVVRIAILFLILLVLIAGC